MRNIGFEYLNRNSGIKVYLVKSYVISILDRGAYRVINYKNAAGQLETAETAETFEELIKRFES